MSLVSNFCQQRNIASAQPYPADSAPSHPDVQQFKPTALRMAKAYADSPDSNCLGTDREQREAPRSRLEYADRRHGSLDGLLIAVRR